MLHDPLGAIDYEENGAGATIVFVPGSCSTAAAWRPIVAALAGRFRCVTTSLPGYGGTAERRTPIDPPMAREVEVVEAVVRRAAAVHHAPVHLVGHSFGGQVALAVALRRQVPVASLVIAEATVLDLLRASGEIEYDRAFRDVTCRYFTAFQQGRPEAIAALIDFYSGPGTFESWPARARDFLVASAPTNILDWASAYGFSLPLSALRTIDVAACIVCGGLSHPALRRTSELLSIHLPDASFVTIDDAAHFMITTHPEEMAGIIARHCGSSIGRRSPPVAAFGA
jgi:pimeloyl-ACP methyl ester carboxylesterase